MHVVCFEIAIGNFLTAARAANVTLPSEPRIDAKIVEWTPRSIEIGGNHLVGFNAPMVTNLKWNPWLGIGKMVSKGFGLLEKSDR